jgi:hypothetical protein
MVDTSEMLKEVEAEIARLTRLRAALIEGERCKQVRGHVRSQSPMGIP